MHHQRGSEIGIEAISYWLPPDEIDNVQFGREHGFPDDFILNKLGIASRHELSEHMSVSDMAAEAIKSLLSETAVEPQQIQFLAVVTQTGDFQLPHTSAIVQDKAMIPESAFVFDISLGCSGFVMGLDIAIATMGRLQLQKGILVTADAYSRIVDPNDRATSPLFGDAASAILLGRQPNWVLGRTSFGSKGDRYENLILRGSGSDLSPDAPLQMDGRAVLDFTRKTVPDSVRDALGKNGIETDEVDLFVFHQANEFVIKSLTMDLGIDSQKVVSAMSDIGNTTSSSIPIALKRALSDTADGYQSILISGFGVGLSWSSGVLFRKE